MTNIWLSGIKPPVDEYLYILRKRDWHDLLVFLLLVAAVAGLFWTAPKAGDFWFSDAPRHAMDGVFYLDLIRDHPLHNIRKYAEDYYLHYPALTILFYPPLFAVVEAIFFGFFGISQSTAQLCVSVFYLAAGWGAYRLCCSRFGVALSFSVSLLFLGLPETAFWGRQVMLEIPACCFMLWTGYFLFRYIDTLRTSHLSAAVCMLVAAIYTKQTAAFLIPVAACLLIQQIGWRVLRNRAVLIATGISVIALLPLIYITLKFGQVNFDSVKGGGWSLIPVSSWTALTYYLRVLPFQAYWTTVVAAGGWLLILVARRKQPNPIESFFIAWFGIGYAFFSSIALKEHRHSTLILFPLAAFAVLTTYTLFPVRARAWGVLVLACSTYTHTLIRTEVPYAGGYREAAAFMAEHAQPGSAILFSGDYNGSFTFNMRTHSERRDLRTLRFEKLFLRMTVDRERGIQELPISASTMSEMISRYGVSYVVRQPTFLSDLEAMRNFDRVVHSAQFRLVRVIPTSGDVIRAGPRLEIYENLNRINASPTPIRMELPIVGISIDGTIGKSERP